MYMIRGDTVYICVTSGGVCRCGQSSRLCNDPPRYFNPSQNGCLRPSSLILTPVALLLPILQYVDNVYLARRRTIRATITPSLPHPTLSVRSS